MKLIGPPTTELSQFLSDYGYVTLWPWPLTSWPLSHVTWCHLGAQCLCQLWDVYDFPFQSYEDFNFLLTASLKSHFKSFLGFKGSNFNFHLSNPQNALPWRERRLMTYSALGCVEKCNLRAWRRNEKKKETFMRQTGYFPRPSTSM